MKICSSGLPEYFRGRNMNNNRDNRFRGWRDGFAMRDVILALESSKDLDLITINELEAKAIELETKYTTLKKEYDALLVKVNTAVKPGK